MLARLDKPYHGKQGSSATRLLPAWNAAEAYKACGGRWDDAFSACPVWQDEAAETGAWSYFAGDKSLHEVWQKSGSKALARLLARLMDMVEMASGRATPRLDITSPIPGEGMAVVRTARGLLIHHVRLAAEKVTDYVIVAPTEWNFHPSGAFAQDMIGLEVRDTEHLQQLAHIAALSLDPCVAYEVEIRDA
jgi:coenzyme F420-reducing hydrogenase alpha subunit